MLGALRLDVDGVVTLGGVHGGRAAVCALDPEVVTTGAEVDIDFFQGPVRDANGHAQIGDRR